MHQSGNGPMAKKGGKDPSPAVLHVELPYAFGVFAFLSNSSCIIWQAVPLVCVQREQVLYATAAATRLFISWREEAGKSVLLSGKCSSMRQIFKLYLLIFASFALYPRTVGSNSAFRPLSLSKISLSSNFYSDRRCFSFLQSFTITSESFCSFRTHSYYYLDLFTLIS
jgi:hypothetical protein